MPYRIIPVTAFAQNCTLLWCAATRQAAIIDPGGDLEKIQAALAETQVSPTLILLTHGHVDHVAGSAALAQVLNIPILGPQRADQFLFEALAQQCLLFGLPPAATFLPDRWLEQGETVPVGDISLQVLHCPGHTPGHLVFFDAAARLALVGDVLFNGSIGRSDFPGGDQRALIHSIKTRLWPLGEDVTFIPGHGPLSTFGEERRYNPFVAD